MTQNARPGDRFPVTTFLLLNGESRSLALELEGYAGLLLFFYRGQQCRYCKEQLQEVESRVDELEQLNMRLLAISADTQERAQQTHQDLNLSRLRLAHGLRIEDARRCGLLISAARKESEMPLFCEPGIFVLRPDERIEASWISSFAFPRPDLSGIIRAIEFIQKTNPSLPPRGSAE